MPQSHISPYKYGDPNAPVKAIERQRDMLSTLLFIILSAAVAAAMIGYSGGMYSSVLKRKREIAIRLTVGALRKDILKQFLIESMMLSFLGALIGAFLGYFLTRLITYYGSWPVYFNWYSFSVAIVSGILFGVLFGVGPARQAASQQPAITARL